jgi:hypothetical protein
MPQILYHLLSHINSFDKTQAMAIGILGGIHTESLHLDVHEPSARIARFDRSIGLNKVLKELSATHDV